MDVRGPDEGIFSFGPFRLDPAERSLTRNGVAIPLPHRVFETLLALVREPDRILTKDELLEAVWPGRYIEEGSLTQAVSNLRKALGGADEDTQYVVTAPGRGYRFAVPVTLVPRTPRAYARAGEATPPSSLGSAGTLKSLGAEKWRRGLAIVLAGCAAIVLVIRLNEFRQDRAAPIGPNVVVQAEFQNGTGDRVFDRVLGKALEIDLAQSPYLRILSRQEIDETLALMAQPKGAPLSADLAQKICIRSFGGAVVTGSLNKLDANYLLTLTATDCVSGRVLADEKAEADTRTAVIAALDRLVGQLRSQLGESAISIEKFDYPLLKERTSSFDALKAYSEATYLYAHGKRTDGVSLLRHAIDLDPNFAMAYVALSSAYYSMNEDALDAAAISKAYALRNLVSERERFLIVARYNQSVTKDMDETIRNLVLWTETFPRDPDPWVKLSNAENFVGQFDAAIDAGKHALALDANNETAYVVLMRAEMHAGQYAAAKRLGQAVIAKGLGGDDARGQLLRIAYAEHDAHGVQQELDWSKGKPGERTILIDAALIAYAEGKVNRGEDLFQESVALAAQRGLPDITRAARARLLQEMGETARAGALLAQLKGDKSPLDYLFTEAEIGDAALAQNILQEDLAAAPADTLLNRVYASEDRAALDLRRGAAAQAVTDLQPAAPYEMRSFDVSYLRGNADLAAKDGAAAARVFQKIIDHQCIDPISPLYSLAYLGLARAYAMQHDMPKARKQYEVFLELWKDADADVPILRSAKSEFENLPKTQAASR